MIDSQYHLSMSVDKNVFTTLDHTNTPVEFYLVNKFLNRCLGTLSVSNQSPTTQSTNLEFPHQKHLNTGQTTLTNPNTDHAFGCVPQHNSSQHNRPENWKGLYNQSNRFSPNFSHPNLAPISSPTMPYFKYPRKRLSPFFSTNSDIEFKRLKSSFTEAENPHLSSSKKNAESNDLPYIARELFGYTTDNFGLFNLRKVDSNEVINNNTDSNPVHPDESQPQMNLTNNEADFTREVQQPLNLSMKSSVNQSVSSSSQNYVDLSHEQDQNQEVEIVCIENDKENLRNDDEKSVEIPNNALCTSEDELQEHRVNKPECLTNPSDAVELKRFNEFRVQTSTDSSTEYPNTFNCPSSCNGVQVKTHEKTSCASNLLLTHSNFFKSLVISKENRNSWQRPYCDNSSMNSRTTRQKFIGDIETIFRIHSSKADDQNKKEQPPPMPPLMTISTTPTSNDTQPLPNHFKWLSLESRSFPRECEIEQCDFEAASKEMFKDHLRIMHPELKLFQCQLCRYICKRKADLKRHYRTVHKMCHDDIENIVETTYVS